MPRPIDRRDFLRSGLVAVGALAMGPGRWLPALAAPAQPGEGPYGPLLPADANGVMLPEGFSSRVIARSGLPVIGVPPMVWHAFPDGGATFPTPSGGWIYVSNSEVPNRLGGASSIEFAADGSIVAARRILVGTSSNCAGGPTPWGTWLSCEETSAGQVWECDPMGVVPAVVHPAMGSFAHEAAAVDPDREVVYLTEDISDGRFYRFTPDVYPDLSSGTLEVARVDGDVEGPVTWVAHAGPGGSGAPGTRFRGGEGTWYDAGIAYFTTKGDNRVWAYHAADARMELIYDDDLVTDKQLTGVDNLVVAKASGDIFVADDGGDLDIVLITPDGVMARLLKVTGTQHSASELAGPAFSPDGTRFYFSSQRGFGLGITYEITGPFRTTRS